MNTALRADADAVIAAALKAVQPDAAVHRALTELTPRPDGKLILVAAGKAAWQMARAAHDALGSRIDRGVVVAKYGHCKGPIGNLACLEGGHPVPDEAGFAATRAALAAIQGLDEKDTVLFLLSGGASALFEAPLLPGEELADITRQLLGCGADIVEMNTVRKRLSAVKGGRFAAACAPARVYSIILSDIVGDPLDMIGSGPTVPDAGTCADALAVVEKYGLRLSPAALELLHKETPKQLARVENRVTGSVKELCRAAADACRALGYAPTVLTDSLTCQARDAGAWLGGLVRDAAAQGQKAALIAGGETVVRLTGSGLGGRNQELALAASPALAGLTGACLFSVGSDGTDGPTDAAGGYVDGETAAALAKAGLDITAVLADNDSYHALQKVGGLIITGPTGTNVNDVAVGLVSYPL